MQNDAQHSERNPNLPRSKGWYALPTAITCISLGLGFYSILLTVEGGYQQSAIALFLAMVADKFDGLVARKTGTYTAFGVQMDSLSDVISFGAAPTLLAYQFALQDAGIWGVLTAIIYTACTALRLARFNVMSATADLRYFTGLPCPAAAAVIASLVWFSVANRIETASFAPAITLLILLLGLAMVSSIRYLSFKVMPHAGLLAIMAVAVVLSGWLWGIPATLFGAFFLYALSGPLSIPWRRKD
jgi:CDP-diacylglycerol--serine O-phosphatidyltransferase